VEAEGGGLVTERGRSGAEIVEGDGIIGFVVGEAGAGGAEDKDGSGLCPHLVELAEGAEDFFVGVRAAHADEEAPGLFVERGRGPAGGFEDGLEVGVAHGAVREGAGAPAVEDLGDDALDFRGTLQAIDFGGGDGHGHTCSSLGFMTAEDWIAGAG